MTCNKQRTANTGLAKVAVQCSADTFVVNESLVLRINICGENRHLRQARKRWQNAPTSGHFAQLALCAIGQRRIAPACYKPLLKTSRL